MAKRVDETTVGILIPTYNRREFLEQALASALGQSYANLAVIVIDNGSTDGTTDYMASVIDPRVRYVVNDRNLGLIGSINRGIGLMPREVTWCTVLCDDDLLDREFVRSMLATVTALATRCIVHSHRIFVDEQGRRIGAASMAPAEETAFDYLQMRALSKRETYLTGVLFQRAAFVEIGSYPAFTTGLLSDDALIFALALRDRLVFSKDAASFIRIHSGAESLTASDAARKLDTIAEFEAYCREKAAGQKADSLDGSLRGYVRAMNSFWWLAGVHGFFDSDDTGEKLAPFIARVVANRDRFSPRVRLAVAGARVFGVCPERFAWYRALWAAVKRLVVSLKKQNRRLG
ncbi:glycosyltransferase family 2 protein [Geobacter argillaceus]|uniref:Glycosyl transferase family 2 n=1 Tax=Geobacter argillaceus TaxID=345631 RepID=A0A562WQU7_9BACT|nr:glycosyltransferase family 2 protein [Geobacter argillaceus]TWJ32608.1 glycosyl transferase family 2 [Geobacter argillaceus]